MKPARVEMRDLECFGPLGREPCGAFVTLACPRCGVHRCEKCAIHGLLCPMCVATDPNHYAPPEVH